MSHPKHIGDLLPLIADAERRVQLERLLEHHKLTRVPVGQVVVGYILEDAELLTQSRPTSVRRGGASTGHAWSDGHLASALRTLIEALERGEARAAAVAGGCSQEQLERALARLREQRASLYRSAGDASRSRAAPSPSPSLAAAAAPAAAVAPNDGGGGGSDGSDSDGSEGVESPLPATPPPLPAPAAMTAAPQVPATPQAAAPGTAACGVAGGCAAAPQAPGAATCGMAGACGVLGQGLAEALMALTASALEDLKLRDARRGEALGRLRALVRRVAAGTPLEQADLELAAIVAPL